MGSLAAADARDLDVLQMLLDNKKHKRMTP